MLKPVFHRAPKLVVCFLSVSFCLMSCQQQIGVFDQSIAFSKQQWPAATRPSFKFSISDTASAYNIFLVFRHTDAYSYNNIWIKFTRTGPDTSYTQQVDLPLANNVQGWLGTGMDDIWEHRVPLTQGAAKFRKPGDYAFTLEQIMRQDPLLHVLNVGVRVERSAQ